MSTLAAISRDDLVRTLGDVVIVEGLPPRYFSEAHLPGAVNIPPDRVEELAPSLLPDRAAAVVVYCQNTACPYAGVVARHLVQLGYRDVAEYAAGVEDWVEAGLPVEQSDLPLHAERAHRRVRDDWRVDIASDQSFPASDAPGWR